MIVCNLISLPKVIGYPQNHCFFDKLYLFVLCIKQCITQTILGRLTFQNDSFEFKINSTSTFNSHLKFDKTVSQ